jgi:Domain of unknown function (DUF1905)/Bacteriocin-protection, YdeI or OmpD-Associated
LKATDHGRKFRFVSRLVQVKPGGYYAVDVPARISKQLGKRGPIPVSAVVNNVADFSASLSPSGGGRHRLRMNARTRKVAEAEAGNPVKVHIVVHVHPLKVGIPQDLKTALRDEGVLEEFEAQPPGKKNHIIDCIGQSARRETREKRIQFTVEFTHRRREKRVAREARKRAKELRTSSCCGNLKRKSLSRHSHDFPPDGQ